MRFKKVKKSNGAVSQKVLTTQIRDIAEKGLLTASSWEIRPF